MKRSVASLLFTALLASCGGGGDDNPGPQGPQCPCFTGILPPGPSVRIEQSDAAVTLSTGWSSTDTRWGWSGGTAVQSSDAGAKATVAFTGSAVRWIGARGKTMGKARVSIDGGPAKEVDLFIQPTDEIRTNALTISGLTEGAHTMTIEVVSGTVVVDAFDVNPKTTVSHWQETDPNAVYSAGWAQASNANSWSGSGISTPPDQPLTAQETTTAGATVTLTFRGTGISWIGYKGPDGGIATVQIDGGTPIEVDTYAAAMKVQEVMHTFTGLTDGNHTLKITATGNKNTLSSSARIVVDAFDVMTPGTRAEENDASIAYNGFWERNTARIVSEGAASRAHNPGASATFTFNGTSVAWIGARKSSGGGTAKIYLDGTFVREVVLRETYPTEAYQATIFRVDGLTNGRHTLKIEVSGDGHVYLDGFDVQ